MSKTVEKAKQAVARVQRELDEIAATYEALEAETKAVVTRVTADVLAGETPEAEGARLREQALRKRDEVQARREALQLALPELIIRLEAAEEAERASMAEKARLRARQAIDNRERALRGFATRARELNSSAREVGRHRELVDASVDSLRGLLSRGEELGIDVDEGTWAEQTDELLEVLQRGPRRPRAEREREREEAAAVATQQTAEILAWFAQRPSEMRLAQVPAHLRPQAEEILHGHEQANEAEQRRLREQAEAREATRV